MRHSSGNGPISGVLRLPEESRRLGRLTTVRWSVLLFATAIAVAGLATVHSASAEMPVDYLSRQLVWVTVGIVAALAAMLVDYRRLSLLALPLYLGTLALLVVVLLAGHSVSGARSWFGIAGLGVQPTELAKLTTALMLARYLSESQASRPSFKEVTVAGLITGMPAVLVWLQPDLGSAVMFLPMLVVVVLVIGVPWRVVLTGACLGLLVAGAYWSFGLEPYQRERITSFLSQEHDPRGAGYQLRQSKIAVGSGELVGKGYMQGTQSQLRFLPERHTDFVFAVLAEEWGFVGVASLLALYSLLLYGLGEIARRARDTVGMLLVAGLLATLAAHIVYNTAMVIGLLPITGIPLPFLSYGGSFTLFAFAAVGLALNVDLRRYVNR